MNLTNIDELRHEDTVYNRHDDKDSDYVLEAGVLINLG